MSYRQDDAVAGAVTFDPVKSVGVAQVLVVDDSQMIRDVVVWLLRASGYRVLAAENGLAAQLLLRAEHPTLIISDLNMPLGDGWELLFHENLQRPDLPFFVITALPLTSAGGADRFAHEFIQNPIDLDALLAAVRHYIGAPRGADASI